MKKISTYLKKRQFRKLQNKLIRQLKVLKSNQISLSEIITKFSPLTDETSRLVYHTCLEVHSKNKELAPILVNHINQLTRVIFLLKYI